MDCSAASASKRIVSNIAFYDHQAPVQKCRGAG
jgi:hypothetical protein